MLFPKLLCVSGLFYYGSVEAWECLGIHNVIIDSILHQYAIVTEFCTARQQIRRNDTEYSNKNCKCPSCLLKKVCSLANTHNLV